ncbi:MAG TPA: hypothetical protein VG819_09440 [Rhizomicrobium sp.]|jgi:hypothetical protein|nr:hypothetical protein [Rhizomicrobium sp.]
MPGDDSETDVRRHVWPRSGTWRVDERNVDRPMPDPPMRELVEG